MRVFHILNQMIENKVAVVIRGDNADAGAKISGCRGRGGHGARQRNGPACDYSGGVLYCEPLLR